MVIPSARPRIFLDSATAVCECLWNLWLVMTPAWVLISHHWTFFSWDELFGSLRSKEIYALAGCSIYIHVCRYEKIALAGKWETKVDPQWVFLQPIHDSLSAFRKHQFQQCEKLSTIVFLDGSLKDEFARISFCSIWCWDENSRLSVNSVSLAEGLLRMYAWKPFLVWNNVHTSWCVYACAISCLWISGQ